MVQCYVNLTESSNRVVNIVKAKFGFKDKTGAINRLISEYERELLEPEFRSDFVGSVLRTAKGPFKEVKDFGSEYGVRT